MPAMRRGALYARLGVVATGVVALGLGGSAVHAGASLGASAPVTQDGHVCTVVGTPKHDVLHGHPGDVVCGLGGNDTLISGGGTETLIGGTGNDKLAGSSGHDTLIGDSGNDKLAAGSGTETLIGGSGNDKLTGGTGHDTLEGDDGNDRLIAGVGPTTMSGGNGNDKLKGGPGHDVVLGGPGNDVISAGAGDDVIDGGSGTDAIDCGTGADQVASDSSDHEATDCQGENDGHDLLSYEGTIASIDANTVSVQWSEVNDGAQAWLDAQSPADPNPVTFSLAGASVERDGGGTPQAGDRVEVQATDTGSGLAAVEVSAEAPGMSH